MRWGRPANRSAVTCTVQPGTNVSTCGTRNGASLKKVCTIVNPQGANGRNQSRWESTRGELQRALGDEFEVVERLTGAAGDAEHIAYEAATEGLYAVLAVGGDGTLHEVVNGLLRAREQGGVKTPPALNSSVEAAAQRLKDGRVQPLDAGEVTVCNNHHPQSSGKSVDDPAKHYFINISSCGFSARVSQLVRWFKWMGAFGYTVAATVAFAGFRNTPAMVFVDGVPHSFGAMTMVAVANGRFFGGGMCIAADADPDDGQLTVVVLDGQTIIDFALKKRHFFDGTIATQPGVTVLHGCCVEVVPAGTSAGAPLLKCEHDGEVLGWAPVSYSILPGALQLLR